MTATERFHVAYENRMGRPVRGTSALCPVAEHDDHDDSLSVKQGDTGVLLTCHKGCSLEAIVAAVGLTVADLFDEPKQSNRPTIAETYDYCDEQGELVYQAVRFIPKGFKQRRPDGRGGWIWDLKGTRRVLFQLPAVIDAVARGEVIHVGEGEKDALSLSRAGVTATCNPLGAGKWQPKFSEFLRRAEVILWRDKDEKGHKHVATVAESLRGVALRVRVVEALTGKDASDHLAAGHTLDEAVPVDDDMSDYDETEPGDDHPDTTADGLPADVKCFGTPIVVTMSDVARERVRWVWPGRLPRGKLVILDGDPSMGKSTLVIDIAARVSTGAPMPDGSTLDGPEDVVILTAEDGLGDTVRPRLEAAGADCSRVHVLKEIEEQDGTRRPPSLPLDVPALERLVTSTRAALVIVDVLTAFLGSKVDTHVDSDVRRALHALANMAERTGVVVILLRHLNKSPGTSAVYRGGGSIAIIGAARAGLLVGIDPEDDARRVLAVSKSNLAREAPSLGYRLVSHPDFDCARVEWLGEVNHVANDLVMAKPGDKASALDEAKEWLAAALEHGPILADTIMERAAEDGIAEKTLKRAKKSLGVESKRLGEPGTKVGEWTWLPPGRGGSSGSTEPPSES